MHGRSIIKRLEKLARDHRNLADLLRECEGVGAMTFATLDPAPHSSPTCTIFDYDELPAEVQGGLRKALAEECAKHMLIIEREAVGLGFDLRWEN